MKPVPSSFDDQLDRQLFENLLRHLTPEELQHLQPQGDPEAVRRVRNMLVYSFGRVAFDVPDEQKVRLLLTVRTSQTKPIIKPAPGGWLERIARFAFPKKSFLHVYEPIIADMRLEYIDALAAGDIWHARWIHARGVIIFMKAVVMVLPLAFVKAIIALAKPG